MTGFGWGNTPLKPVFLVFSFAIVNTPLLHLLVDADDTGLLLYWGRWSKKSLNDENGGLAMPYLDNYVNRHLAQKHPGDRIRLWDQLPVVLVDILEVGNTPGSDVSQQKPGMEVRVPATQLTAKMVVRAHLVRHWGRRRGVSDTPTNLQARGRLDNGNISRARRVCTIFNSDPVLFQLTCPYSNRLYLTRKPLLMSRISAGAYKLQNKRRW